MIVRESVSRGLVAALAVASLVVALPAAAATKTVDLDGQSANGAESQCDLNVLQTFPVKIENKVTNKAVNDAFNFSWPSAGPGGFTSSVTPGSTGGVGAKWTWTTNQTVYSYTGSTCDKDICFTQTAGPDTATSFCSTACLVDAATLTIAKGAIAGQISLTWAGGTPTYSVYRSTDKNALFDPANIIATTEAASYTDTPPADLTVYYAVRGVDCQTRKACSTDADCSRPGDGTCVTRGPFSVPGRSLYTNDVTVSSASLTSSLITFFSPPKEVFRVTSTAQPGGTQETVTNNSTAPVTAVTEAYPPGCCPPNPDVPHQLRCGETCVDYLNDPSNCGACGNVCGDGTCCSDGICTSLCAPGQTWCDGQCVDFQNDNANCGACGNACGEGTCCSGGVCASECSAGDTYCSGGRCADFQDDSTNCGACGVACASGTCCDGGSCASLCAAGQTWCNEKCADFQNDSNNCGACGTVCGDGTCCNGGACVSVCAEGQVWCNGQCVDLQNDNANCGACGNVCGDGTCCGSGTCNSLCAEGQTWCNGQCVDFSNDSGNCGACGNVCGDGTCCGGGTCNSVCAEGSVWCDGLCADVQNDSNNCGACGNVCGDGTCCNGGSCVSVCPAGQTWCNGQCVDFENDSTSCGTCGNACGDGTCCSGGACVSECPAGRVLCNGQCVDLQNDHDNCGTCGKQCERNDSCRQAACRRDDFGVTESSHSDPVPPVCPNPHPTTPGPGVCPNPTPSSGPVPGACHNPTSVPVAGVCSNTHPTTPLPGSCPNPTPSSGPVDGVCPNPHPSPGPVDAACPNLAPSYPVAGVCPGSNPSAPAPNDAPICEIPSTTTTIPPGGSATTCTSGGVLFKEVPTAVLACGDSLPGPDGVCANGVTHVSKGTFMRLVPDTGKTVGAAYVTPYAVHVTADSSNDGMLQPGETASLTIELLNAGTAMITGATATLAAPTVDLTQDGVDNPVGIAVTAASSSYGTIQGTQPTTDCTPPALLPASNTLSFQVSVPVNHPGDTSHPFTLDLSGTVNGGPFSMSVPIALGIADACNHQAATRDYDGLDGLSSPMAKLVPTGDSVPFPAKAFPSGNTRPMKLRVSCGGVNLSDAYVDAPEIVGLSEATRGVLNLELLHLNSDNSANPNDPFFRFNNSLSGGGQWVYNMRTADLGTGAFTITIRIAGRKEYVTGFVLE